MEANINIVRGLHEQVRKAWRAAGTEDSFGFPEGGEDRLIPLTRVTKFDNVAAAMIVAGRDSVIPVARSEALRSATRNLVFDCIIADAEHNGLYERPEFWSSSAAQCDKLFAAEIITRLERRAQLYVGALDGGSNPTGRIRVHLKDVRNWFGRRIGEAGTWTMIRNRNRTE